MNRATILEILEDWNYWHTPPETGTPREALADLVPLLDQRHIIAITGVRRCGKSTLMRQLGEAIAGRDGRHRVVYVNFEDPRWLPELGPELIEEILDAYRERHNPTDRAFVFLDEVQAVPNWERWARSAYDRQRNVKIVVSGSTASLLGGTLGTLLTGRHLSVELYPFSFRERLLCERITVPEGDYHAVLRHRTRIRSALANYLEWGGFPEVCQQPPEFARRLLQQYFDDIIARDLVYRHSVRDISALRKLAHFAITNIGNELSSTSLAATFGVSTDTVREYLNYLSEAYLAFAVPYASPSLKVVARRNSKTYAVDCGLRNAVSQRFSRDTGRLAENLVYLWLKGQGIDPGYWRNGGEADFIVQTGEHSVAMNVCFTDKLPEREVTGLRQAMSALKISDGLVVSDNLYRSTEKLPEGRVGVVPLWYLLLCRFDPLVQEVLA